MEIGKMKKNGGTARLRARRGFTYAELLIVVAIIAALSVIGIMSIASMRKNMEQTKLDRIAENLYTAAQNQLTLRAARDGKANDLKAKIVADTPADMVSPGEDYFAPDKAHPLYYVIDSADEAELIFPTDSDVISSEIRNGSWIVELEPDSCSVYSVFYVENKAAVDLASLYGGGATSDVLSALRGTVEARKNAGNASVGYFSGNVADPDDRTVGELKCKIELTNGEKLTAKITATPVVEGDEWMSKLAGKQFTLELKVKGMHSGAERTLTKYIDFDLFDGNAELEELVLDALASDKTPNQSFWEQFCTTGGEWAGDGILLPGEDIELQAKVWYSGEDILLYPGTDSARTNSLYADGSLVDGKTVYVAFGRHLQNLNVATSGFSDTLAAGALEVWQSEDISFASAEMDAGESDSPWYIAYGKNKTFTPITNVRVAKYVGSKKTIHALRAETEGANAGVFAVFAGNEINGITLSKANIKGGAVGGFIGAAYGAVEIRGCKLEECAFTATSGAAGGLVGNSGGTLTVSNITANKCEISGSGISGGLAGEAAALDATACEVKDCTVSGKSAAGGVAGSVTGEAKLAKCSFFFDSEKNGVPGTGPNHTDHLANNTNVVTATSGAAGGLVASAGSVTINESFAATILRGTNYAGGLAGRVSGALTVTSSYANCYVNAPTIGGLAGYCGAGSSFTSCYSAGFALYGGTSITKAAGFVPSSASVSYCYTIFCFDDSINVVKVDDKTNAPTPAPDTMARYAFTAGGTMDNAYYTYSQVQSTSATLIDAGNLETKSIAGFNTGKVRNWYYQFNRLKQNEDYPYPTIPGLRHYNDSYVVTGRQIDLYRFSLTGKKPIERDLGAYAYSQAPRSGNFVTANFNSGLQRNEVFVGWLDEDGLKALQELGDVALLGLCDELDRLVIANGRLDQEEARAIISQLLTYEQLEDEQMKIDVKDAKLNATEPKLYALYREVSNFEVVIRFMNFDEAAFAQAYNDQHIPTSMNFDVTARKYYLGDAFAVRQDIVYTINPLMVEGYATETRDIEDISTKLESTGYTVAGREYLAAKYNNKINTSGFYPAAAFEPEEATANPDKVVTVDPDPYDETTDTLSLRMDKARIYVVLCDADLLNVPVKMIFHDVEVAADTKTSFTLDKSKEDPYAELRAILTQSTTHYKKGTDYTPTVWMRFPPNVVVWSELPKFDGFELDSDNIKNPTISNDEDHVYVNGEGKLTYIESMAPQVPYNHIPYTLAFDLNGGFCETYKTDADGKITMEGGKPVITAAKSIDALTEIYCQQSLKVILPLNQAAGAAALDSATADKDYAKQAVEHGYLVRPGYTLKGWKFYQLESYGAEGDDAKPAEREVDKNTGMITGATAEMNDYLMPAYSVIAVADWSKIVTAPIRVEIYIQNVTDDYRVNLPDADEDHIDEEPTYAFYRSYEISEKQTVSNYEKLNYNSLLQQAFAYDRTTNEAALGSDDREYLIDPVTKSGADGTIKNPQLKFDNLKSTGSASGTKITPIMDASGTAVFKVYYRRNINVFHFDTNSNTDESIDRTRAPKLPADVSDTGYPSGYSMYQVREKDAVDKYDRALKQESDPGGAGYPDGYGMYQVRWQDAVSRGRALKQHNDPGGEGYPDGYQLYQLTWDNWNDRFTIYYEGRTRNVWLINDNRIDDFVKGTTYDSNSDDHLANNYSDGGGIVTISGQKYVFGKIVAWGHNNTYWISIAPFYDSGDETAAKNAGYTWTTQGLWRDGRPACYDVYDGGRWRNLWLVRDGMIDGYVAGTSAYNRVDTELATEAHDGIFADIDGTKYIFGKSLEHYQDAENNYCAAFAPFYDQADVAAATADDYKWSNSDGRIGLYKKSDTVQIGYEVYYNNRWRELWLVREELIDGYAAGTSSYKRADTELATTEREAIFAEIGGTKYIFGKPLESYRDAENNRCAAFAPFYDRAEISSALGDGYVWVNTDSVKGLYKETDNANYDVTIKGLYEQPLTWPKNGTYRWDVYYLKGGYHDLEDGISLTYLSSYYYVTWIDQARSNTATTLLFNGAKNSGSNTVKFYQEKDGDRGNTIQWKTDPSFTYTNGSGNGSFTLNDKYDGYTVCGYKNGNGGYTSASSGKKIENYTDLKVYFKRNAYNLIYLDVANLSAGSYLYGQTIKSLPKITRANEATYRPTSVSSGCHFIGWFTESAGGGRELIESGGKVYAVARDLEGNETSREEYKMPSNNLTIFAFWATDNVKVKLFSRLPDCYDESALLTTEEKETMDVFTCDVRLYEKIPDKAFNDLYGRWANHGSYDNKVYTVGSGGDQKEYYFSGWFRSSGIEEPEHDRVLTSRFYEQEYVVSPSGEFTLAAQWTQHKGVAYYNVRCYLLDEAGNVEKTVDLKNYDFAAVGEALNVAAPSTSRYPQLDGYYPLKSMGRLDVFQPPLKDTVEFWYKKAESWKYTVDYQVMLTDISNSSKKANLTFYHDERKSSAENVYVRPNDELDGFRLSPATQEQREIKRTDSDANKRVVYTYVIDQTSIKLNESSWIKGGAIPALLTVRNGVGNTIASADENYEVRTSYAYGGSKTYQLSDLPVGAYPVTASLELWTTGEGGTQVLTFYRGSVNVKVCRTINAEGFPTMYHDGTGFYLKNDETGKLENTKLSDLTAARAAELHKTFLGFWVGSTQVVDRDGRVIGAITGDTVTFTAKFE